MNSRAGALCVVVWLLIAMQSVIGQTSEETVWRRFTRGHDDPVMAYPALSTNILRLTAWRNGWSGTLMFVEEGGLETVLQAESSPIRTREIPWKTQLTPANVVRLRQLLHELAQTSNSVPFWITNYSSKTIALPTNQLVMVSFRDGMNWVRRQYSDAALPSQLFKCYDLILPTETGFPDLNRGR